MNIPTPPPKSSELLDDRVKDILDIWTAKERYRQFRDEVKRDIIRDCKREQNAKYKRILLEAVCRIAEIFIAVLICSFLS